MMIERFDLVMTALAPIAHGGESRGTVQTFHQQKVLGPAGVQEIPTVTANSLRGQLRRSCMEVALEAAGIDSLSLPAVHLLFSGGALEAGGRGGKAVDLNAEREMRELLPPLSVFGAAVGGRIIEGKMTFSGPVYPVCREVEHLLPAPLRSGILPSVWELSDLQEYTRRDDAKTEHGRGYLATGELRALEDGERKARDRKANHEPDLEAGQHQQMRYGVQCLAAGTRFWVAAMLRSATPAERASFIAGLCRWGADARLGGMTGRGHGKVAVKCETVNLPDPLERGTDGDPLAIGATLLGEAAVQVADYLKEIADRREQIVAWLENAR